MKKFTVFMGMFLSILLFSSTISSTLVFANNDQAIDELLHGEEVNWDNIEWEEIDIEYNNDEDIMFEEEFYNEEYEEIDLDEGKTIKQSMTSSLSMKKIQDLEKRKFNQSSGG